MKNLLLSIGVIAALVAGLVGGIFADFSDSEEEMGDSLQAGSMDLKVNNADDPDVLPFVIKGMVPEKQYDVTKKVKNVGTIDGWLYIHIKNAKCTETNDKDLNGDGQITAPADNPEPENVAELGGKVGQKQVPGLGVACDMEKHIAVQSISYDGDQINISAYDKNKDGVVKLDEIQSYQIKILVNGQQKPLEACGAEHKVTFLFVLQDVPEEFYGLNIFNNSDPNEVKWNNWPTNRYQGDTVTFDVLFELLQVDP